MSPNYYSNAHTVEAVLSWYTLRVIKMKRDCFVIHTGLDNVY